jgi:DNA repair photolyase
VFVFMSIAFADDATGRALDPGAAAIHRRFETLATLSAAGIDTGIAIAPIIPGLNDRAVPELLARAKEAGAQRAFHVMLRLPAEVKPVFLARIREAVPGSADKIEHAVIDVRAGRLYDNRFGHRMRGSGPRWDAISELFALQVKRLGMNLEREGDPPPTTFERPGSQLKLF